MRVLISAVDGSAPPVPTRSSSTRSLSSADRPEPAAGPFTYEVDFDATQPVGACTAIPGVSATGPRTVAFTLPTMAEAISRRIGVWIADDCRVTEIFRCYYTKKIRNAKSLRGTHGQLSVMQCGAPSSPRSLVQATPPFMSHP